MVSGPAPPPIEPAAAAPPPQPRGPSGAWIALGFGLVAVAVAIVVIVLALKSDDPTGATLAGTIPGTTQTTGTTPETVTTADDTSTSTSSTSSTTTTSTSVPAASGDVDASGSWTVMIYGLGDNDLESFFVEDLREMRRVTSTVPDLTFVVLADRADGYSADTLGPLGDWTGTRLISISGGEFAEIRDWGEQNLGEAVIVGDFLTEAAAAAPADHYGLIFWDHGSMQGIGPDESHGDTLESWEIAGGIELGIDATGVALDFVGFDACLMGSLEIASVVAPYATFMIASEELEPGEGWQYGGFDYLAAADPTVIGLGQSLLDAYHETSAPGYPLVTLSMLDLRLYDQFAATLDGFTGEALQTIDLSAAQIGRRRDKSVKFGTDPDPLYDWFMVDLGQMLRKISRSDAPVAEEAAAAADLLDQMVVANVTGAATEGARGLAVHFPSAPEHHYPLWYEAYGDPAWGTFLDGYFTAGEALPRSRQAAVVDTSPDTAYLFDDYGLELTAEIDPGAFDSVVSAVLWSGVPEADGSVTFYSSDQGIVEGPYAVGFYDLTQLWLSDGEDDAVAFQQLTISEDLTVVTMTVPLAYRAPIDPANAVFADPIDVILKVTFNIETEEFTEELFAAGGATAGAFVADPNGLIYPKVPYRLADGTLDWVYTTEVGLWADLPIITYDFVDLVSGTPLYGELRISDFGGNTATFEVTTTVP